MVIKSSKHSNVEIAITGATGSIGRQLVYALLEKGYELVLLGKNKNRLKKLFDKHNGSFRLMQTNYGYDLNDQLNGVNAIVHLAGLRYQQNSTLDDYLHHNFSVTQRLFTAALFNGIRNIVFASTRSVYNPVINKSPFSEDEDCFPVTSYGVSKLLCEKIAHYYNQKFNLRIKCLRLSQIVTANERFEFMLGKMLRSAANKQTIEIWGTGAGIRDYIYVKDACSAILKSLEKSEAQGVFNICSGIPVTNLQLAETINEVFDNPGNLIFIPEKFEDTQSYILSTKRTKTELGWEAKWSLRDMLVDLSSKYKT